MTQTMHSVFISSTYDDLKEERAKVKEILLMHNCFPVGMESFPSTDEENWNFIKRQITEADYYLLILAGRYGSLSDDGVSYTEKEYDYAKERGKPIMAFIHANLDKITGDKLDQTDELKSKRNDFIEKVKKSRRLVKFYNCPNDLSAHVSVSIANIKQTHPQPGFVRADQMSDPKKYADLLEENALLKTQITEYKNNEAIFSSANTLVNIELRQILDKEYDIEKLLLREIFIIVADWIIFEQSTYTQTAASEHSLNIHDPILHMLRCLFDNRIISDNSYNDVKRHLYAAGLIIFNKKNWELTHYY